VLIRLPPNRGRRVRTQIEHLLQGLRHGRLRIGFSNALFKPRADTGQPVQLKALLEPFHITRYATDGWDAYDRHVEPDQHTEDREQTHQPTDLDQAVGASDDLFFQDRTDA
jgi:IS1 transposase